PGRARVGDLAQQLRPEQPQRVVRVLAHLLREQLDRSCVVVLGQRLQRLLAVRGVGLGELVLRPRQGAVQRVRPLAELALLVELEQADRVVLARDRQVRLLLDSTGARSTTLPTPSLRVAGLTLPTRGQVLTVPSRLPVRKRSPGAHSIAVTGSVWLLPRPLSSGSSLPRACVESSFRSAPAEKKRSSSRSNSSAVTAPSCSRADSPGMNSALSSASKIATVPLFVPATSQRPVGSAARQVPGSGSERVWRTLPSLRASTVSSVPASTASRSSARRASAAGATGCFGPNATGVPPLRG